MNNRLCDREFFHLLKLRRKLHRVSKQLAFLQKCLDHSIIPPSIRFSNSSIPENTLHQLQINKLSKIITEVTRNLSTQSDLFFSNFDSITSSFSSTARNDLLKSISNNISKSESKADRRRDQKFVNLNAHNFSSLPTVDVINYSDTPIPSHITNILKSGVSRVVGGAPSDTKLFPSFEYLINSWLKFIKVYQVPFMTQKRTIAEVNYYLHQLRQCYTVNKDISTLKNFLQTNKQIKLIKIDKSKHLAFIKSEDYYSKLNAEFPRTKFIRLESDPTSKDITEYHKMINLFSSEISHSTKKQIDCNHKIKNSFGLLKTHKPEHPVRPIIASPSSITSGIEKYIYDILSKIVPDLKYSCASTKEFKSKFLKISKDISSDDHCVWSADIVSMYPNIDIEAAINVIIKILYKQPMKYFEPEEMSDGSIKYFPDQNIFKSVLISVLKEFTSFATEEQYYKQKSGCSMGSRLAPLVANIFISSLETSFIDSEIQKGNLIFCSRYVDDYCFVSKISAKNRIFKNLNKFHPMIKMTCESMDENNRLPYLDTCISIHQNKYELFFYEKPNKSEILTNFKSSVTPLNQKISTLTGEIYRRYNTTTCKFALDIALKQLTERFLKNSYPLMLIKKKIKEITDLNFEPLKRDESDIVKKFYLSLDFTSERCYKIGLSLQKIFQKVSPKFRLIVSWRTIRLDRALGQFLKKVPEKYDMNDVIYKWTCPCKSSYIGQTKRRAGIRWCEHVNSTQANRADPSVISLHMSSCSTLDQQYKTFLSDPSTKNFPSSHRTKCSQSDYALKYFHGNNPPKIRRKFTKNDFALKYFDILRANLSHETNRKKVESFLILLHTPNINKQKDFTKFHTL